jgi:PAS domain S-box-containing protein
MPKQVKKTETLLRENEGLRSRLEEAEEALRAIRRGEVDALVLQGPDGNEVFTLKTADHAYRLLVEEMQEGAVVVAGDGSTVYANLRFAQMLKEPLERVMGCPFKDWVIIAERDRLDALMREANEGRARGEFTFAARDGSAVPVYVSANRFFMEGRLSLSVVVTDLTDQKRIEEVVAADQAKTRFLAMLSHELRTPLNPVMVTVQVLERDRTLSPELRESVAMIRRNVEMEMRLIDDLLDLTKVSQGKVRLQQQAVDAHVAMRSALEINQPEIASKQLVVSLRLWAEGCHVWADPARLQQILWNVLKNAVKFTPQSGRINITSTNGDGKLRIAVADTGIGIQPEALGMLFDAFEQADESITRRYGGLGLGLTISKALAEMHGGTLTAASEGTDKGATFTLELPTVAAASPDAVPLEPDVPSWHNAPCRILLVEDHADTLRIMARLLRSSGHTVQTAGSVRGAIAAAEHEAFHLLISDIGLPDGSGIDIMNFLKSRYGTVGIALSGFGHDDDLRNSEAAGFMAHLVKPIDLRKLEEAICEAMVEQGQWTVPAVNRAGDPRPEREP